MSYSLVNINHLVFSVPTFSEKKKNCLVESEMGGDSGHRCVSLFLSMSENQSCKQPRVSKPLIVHNLYLMSSFPVQNSPSVMLCHWWCSLLFTSRQLMSNEAVYDWWGKTENYKNALFCIPLKGDSNLVRLVHFPYWVCFYQSIVFIISLPVCGQSIRSQSLGKENASIWFLRLYNL